MKTWPAGLLTAGKREDRSSYDDCPHPHGCSHKPTPDPAHTAPYAPDGTVQYVRIGDLQLESGATLPDVVLAFETWGTLNADASNAVLIEHALTGDTHVTRGASEEPGWWEQLAGPGAPVDTDKYFVVSINILGGC